MHFLSWLARLLIITQFDKNVAITHNWQSTHITHLETHQYTSIEEFSSKEVLTLLERLKSLKRAHSHWITMVTFRCRSLYPLFFTFPAQAIPFDLPFDWWSYHLSSNQWTSTCGIWRRRKSRRKKKRREREKPNWLRVSDSFSLLFIILLFRRREKLVERWTDSAYLWRKEQCMSILDNILLWCFNSKPYQNRFLGENINNSSIRRQEWEQSTNDSTRIPLCKENEGQCTFNLNTNI